jgi:aspartate carbamoyltransferase
MKNFISLENYDVLTIEKLIDRALEIKKTQQFPDLSSYYIANLFFENSTRTKCSFEVAERKCQMQVIPFEAQTSSVQKGETLYDTIKTLESIQINAVVIRHQQDEYYKELTNIHIPIINGGDGTGNHPSQSLLDLVTIKETFGYFQGLNVTIVGDVIHSRVAHSNIAVLQRLGVTVKIAAPTFWQERTIEGVEFITIDEAVDNSDVIMLLRIQHERHHTNFNTETFLADYGLTIERAKRMKQGAIIMHPAPVNRGVEIDTTLVEAENSRIFEQMTNGLYARAAILELMFTSLS